MDIEDFSFAVVIGQFYLFHDVTLSKYSIEFFAIKTVIDVCRVVVCFYSNSPLRLYVIKE